MKIVVIGAEGIGHLSVAHLNSLAEGIRALDLAEAGPEMQIYYLGNSLREVQLELPPLPILEMPDCSGVSHSYTIDLQHQLRKQDVAALQALFERCEPELPMCTHIEPIKLREMIALAPEHKIKPQPFRGYMKRASRRRWL